MNINLNESIDLCGTTVHIHSISLATGFHAEKTYYQHRHPGHEIQYVIRGQCKVTYNNNNFPLRTESLLLIPPGTYHDVSACLPDTSRLCISFNIQKLTRIGAKIDRNEFYAAYRKKSPIVVQIDKSEAQNILLKIVSTLDSATEDPFRNDKLLALSSMLLLEMIPHISATAQNEADTEQETVQEDISFKIDSFIGTNFMRNDAKKRMAEGLFVSPRQLQRIIKKNYGMNYRQKLAETRIQIAMDLLRNSDMSIHKIADILGYSCSANFSAFIKRNTGKTPSQIRKKY